ncbi:MAG: phosphopantetheine adenylyltransferase [Pseudomonadales bacterium]|nr:phosphopantetheine adenylyltransferase [Pseudomonadales bacterium]
MLLTIAAIHLAPLVGFLGAERLESLYGIAIESSELEILMRHRAILFGILGGVFVTAAFKRAFQHQAFIIAAATLVPFFYLVAVSENYNEAISTIVRGDIIALLCLTTAVVLRYLPAMRN